MEGQTDSGFRPRLVGRPWIVPRGAWILGVSWDGVNPHRPGPAGGALEDGAGIVRGAPAWKLGALSMEWTGLTNRRSSSCSVS